MSSRVEKIVHEVNSLQDKGIIDIEVNDHVVVDNVNQMKIGYRQLVEGNFKIGFLHIHQTENTLEVFHTTSNENDYKLFFPLNNRYVKKHVKSCFRKWFEKALYGPLGERKKKFKDYLRTKTKHVNDISSEEDHSSSSDSDSSNDSDSSRDSDSSNDSNSSSDSSDSDNEMKANEKAKSLYFGDKALDLYQMFMSEINAMLHNKIIDALDDDEETNDIVIVKTNLRKRILNYERHISNSYLEGKLTLQLKSNRKLSLYHYNGRKLGFPFQHTYVQRRPLECFRMWFKYIHSEPHRNRMTRFKQWCEEQDRFWTLRASGAQSNTGISKINSLPSQLLTNIFRQSLTL